MLLPPLRDDIGPRLWFATTVLFGIACLIYALTGCSPTTTPKPSDTAVIAAVDASVQAVALVYEAEQRACPRDSPAKEDACIAEVRARWSVARSTILAASAAVRAAMGAK